VGPIPQTLPTMTRLFNDFLGMNHTEEEMLAMAEKVLLEEVQFNEKAGITKYQNDLPEFFRTETLHSDLVCDLPAEELMNIYN
jgi:aldehyde:ferredoxin oxidoreductase